MRERDITDTYKLSPMQQGTLFDYLLAPRSGLDIQQMICDLDEDLDAAAFKRAWERAVERYAILRTSYRWDGLEEPLQEVHRHVRLPWAERDWRGVPPEEQRTRLDEYLEEDRMRGFDLGEPPAIRLMLIRNAENHYTFVWTKHQIVQDGRTTVLIFKEVFACYEALLQGKELDLEVPRPYREYIDWFEQRDLRESEAYFRELLKDFTPLVLPAEQARHEDSRAGKADKREQEIKLSEGLTSALKEGAERNGFRLNTMVLGAWGMVLSRYSGEEDVVFGEVRSCRRSALEGARSMAGLLMNNLPLRVRLSHGRPLLSYLQEIRDQQVALRDHEHTPLAKIYEWAGQSRRNPLFESFVLFDNALLNSVLQGQGGNWERRSFRQLEKADYPLALYAWAEPEMVLRIAYDASRFPDSTVARMCGHLRQILQDFAESEGSSVSDLCLLTEGERHTLLVEWNATRAEFPREQTVHGLFVEQAARTPDKTAAVFGGVELTYGELNRRANQVARYLHRLGVGPEVFVGICMKRSAGLLVGLLGILKAGGAYVPLDPKYPRDRLAYMLEDARVPVLLTEEALKGALPESGARVVCLDTDREVMSEGGDENPAGEVESNGAAYLIYTSGSTGSPKGVVGLHRGAVNRFRWMWRKYPFEEGEVCCLKTSLSFVDSVWEVFGPLLQGVPTVVIPDEWERDPQRLIQELADHGVTRIVLVPSLLRVILEAQEDLRNRLPHLRIWVTSGEALPVELAERFYACMPGSMLINLYGSSEVSADATCYEVPAGMSGRSVPIGRPIDNTLVYLLDAHLQPVPIGVPGEICVGGEGVARGYFNREELTRERFLRDPFREDGVIYRTGDLGRYLPDGNIEYMGRRDHQVKIHGFRIELGEIETVLAGHEAVAQAVVRVVDLGPGDTRLAAYIVVRPGHGVSAGDLRNHLRARLPEYMVPQHIVELDAFPLTPAGKIDRQGLPDPVQREERTEKECIAPLTPTEETLARIWCDVLGVKRVNVHDNFFDVGGHSLLAIRLLSRVRGVFRASPDLGDFLRLPTLSELAKGIDGVRLRAGVPPQVKRIEKTGNLPLSFGQQRLWFLDQLEPDTSVYSIPSAVRLAGRLDRSVLERALGEIMSRHEVLRTTFQEHEGLPVQVVAPPAGFALPLMDLGEGSPSEGETELAGLLREASSKPFRLSEGPLVRGMLVRVSEEEHVLFFLFHHIVCDGWSIGVFYRELAALYETFVSGKPSPLPELTIQYADFAVWQRERLAGDELDRQLSYWRENLRGELAPLEMPTDRPRPPLSNYGGSRESFRLSKAQTESLAALGRSEGATLFMVLLAAFQVLLYRYTGREDLCVGTPIANRIAPEIKDLIGFFVNTLVLRTDLSGDPSFREALRRVREVTLGAYSHQDLPFEKLVEELKPGRDMSRSPLFQVMFASQDVLAYPQGFSGLEVTPLKIDRGTSMFDLTLSVREEPDGVAGTWEYRCDLFDPSTIRRLLAHYQVLLNSLLEDPDEAVSSLCLLADSEKRQLADWGGSRLDFPKDLCLHQLVEAQVEKTPNSIAVEFEGLHLTYKELDERANQLANHLQALRVGPDVVVGVFMERSLEMVVTLLGVLKAGGAYLPLDPEYPAERTAFMMQDCRIPVAVTQTRVRSRLPGSGFTAVCLDENWKAIDRESREKPRVAVEPEHLAYVIYTSGSTGTPKGVMIPHGAICNHMLWMQTAFPLTEGDRVLQKTPFTFDASVWEFHAPLMAGARLIMARPGGHQESSYLVEMIADRRISILQVVPSLLQVLVEEPGLRDCASLRRLFCGGEALSFELQGRFFALHHAELVNLYGPTETAIDATCWVCERGSSGRTVPIGRPVANTQVYVLDGKGQQVPIGVFGELHIGGAQVARGYMNQPLLTREKFIRDPFREEKEARLYKTGDVVRFLADGSLEFVGRMDHQIKVRGVRIELGEIESVLGRHKAVKQAVAVVREDRPGDARLVAYLLMETGGTVTGTDLRKYMRTKVPEYMIPQHFVELESFVLTSSGKIDRKKLPDPLSGARTPEQTYVAPRTDLEKFLALTWQDVVGVHPVGLNDNFFEIGGHSLQLMQVVARIARTTGVKVSPRVILLNNLEQAAAEIEAQIPPAAHEDAGEKERRKRGIVSKRFMRWK